MWICSDQWEEKRGLFGFFFIMFSYFSRRDPGRGERGSISCALDLHMPPCNWHLNNCSHLANKKNASVRVNQSLKTTETERWKEPVSLMIHTIVALNRPILLPALLLTWDNTLPYCWGQFELGSFVLCIRSPTRTFSFGNITNFFVSGMVQLSEFQQSWIWDDIVF